MLFMFPTQPVSRGASFSDVAQAAVGSQAFGGKSNAEQINDYTEFTRKRYLTMEQWNHDDLFSVLDHDCIDYDESIVDLNEKGGWPAKVLTQRWDLLSAHLKLPDA